MQAPTRITPLAVCREVNRMGLPGLYETILETSGPELAHALRVRPLWGLLKSAGIACAAQAPAAPNATVWPCKPCSGVCPLAGARLQAVQETCPTLVDMHIVVSCLGGAASATGSKRHCAVDRRQAWAAWACWHAFDVSNAAQQTALELVKGVLKLSLAALQVVTEAAEAAEPVLLFCKVGKDRTGMLACLIAACCGASPSQLVADYHKCATAPDGSCPGRCCARACWPA